jgi:hypothetical protein
VVLISRFQWFTRLPHAGALALAMLAGCSVSLFDVNATKGSGGGGDDGGGGEIPVTCAAPCLADGAADFNGTAGGASGHWRYLDDHRDRTWAPMALTSMTKVGDDAGNHITTCAAQPAAAACKALPGALLVTSTGSTSPADPALEVTAPTNQVLQLTVHAYVATGAPQAIRIYRNSREDVLYTGIAMAGAKLDQSVTVDALAGDRFLVAVAPNGTGATDVGLQVFLNPTGAAFPWACQLAVPFTSATGNTVPNLCGAAFTQGVFDGADGAPVLSPGPFAELGTAGDLTATHYYRGTDILDKSHDTTLQLWIKHRKFDDDIYDSWLFSDIDLNNMTGGGIGVALRNFDPPTLEVQTSTSDFGSTPPIFKDIAYPTDGSWQFLRVVHTGGNLNICLNGLRKGSVPVAEGHLTSTLAPTFGSNERWSPQGAYVNGEIDDVRVLSGALPCE